MPASTRTSPSPHAPLRRPPLLAPGARVALVSPAGPLRGADDLARAVGNVRALGWEPVVGEHVLARRGYFAGEDALRLADLDRALRDPSLDGIWCVRGGYGAMRLLDGIDWTLLARRPRALLGYSDITAFHCAVAARAGIASYHAPTARAELSDFSRRSLERAAVRGEDPCGAIAGARTVRGGSAEGRLAGGNLALLASLVGTPYMPSLDGAILVLEDINEAVYRIDRMLTQLRLAGLLGRLAGLVFGAFTDCPEEADDGARSLDEVVDEVAAAAGVPCVAGAPIGHIAEQWTLPLGLTATLDADAGTLHVH